MKNRTQPNKTWPITRILSLFFLLFVISLFSCTGRSVEKGPFFREGVLDLSELKFTGRERVKLSGQWQFFQKGQKESRLVLVPENWKKTLFNPAGFQSGTGWGTYTLEVKLPAKNRPSHMGIYTGLIGTAYSLKVNGTLVMQKGVPGKSDLTHIPALDPSTAYFPVSRQDLKIELFVSNFTDRSGGIWNPIYLGEVQAIESLKIKKISYEYFFIGCYLLIIMYHLILFFFRRKEPLYLFFALFCGALLLRLISTGEMVITDMFPVLPFSIYYKFLFLSVYMGFLFYVLYLNRLFPGSYSKILISFILASTGISMFITLVTHPLFYSEVMFYLFIIHMILMSGIVIQTCKLLFEGKEDALLFFFSMILLFIVIVNDYMAAYDILETSIAGPFGMLFFIIFQAIIVAKRFAKSFRTTEELEKQYETLVNSVEDGVFIISNWRVVFVNNALCRITEYKKDELQGNRFGAFISSRTFSRIYSLYKKSISTGKKPVPVEIEIITRSGEHIPGQVTASILFLNRKKVIIGTFTDLRERKKREKLEMSYRRQLENEVSGKTALLEEKNGELEEKNYKILDSLNYAGRVQNTILPSHQLLGDYFAGHFIIWRPRDIIGGDFYWAKEKKNMLLFALGDCTGHGVSGAIMTMAASSALSNLTAQNHFDDPAELLARLNRYMKASFNPMVNETRIDNGLDIGICMIDSSNRTIRFAGAKISLFCLDKNGISEIPGDRQSVGYQNSKADYRYSSHTIRLPDGNNTFYLTTDGFLDQIVTDTGLPVGKKGFKKLILEKPGISLAEQKIHLESSLYSSMEEEPQLDDITVVGFTLA